MELLNEIADTALTSGDATALPEPLVTKLKQENYFTRLLPEALSGQQMDYPGYIRFVQSVARADGSTGWCVNQGSVLASLARLVPEDTAKEIWHSPGVTLANGPPVKSESQKTKDGYLLTGTWTFSSGINHADWLLGMAPVKEDGKTRAFFWYLFPKHLAVIENNWDVSGLRATGSYQFSVESLPILQSHAIAIEVRPQDPPLYQIPMNLLFAGGFAAVALGVSRAALDFTEERLRKKIKRFDKQAMNQDWITQDQVAKAEALWQSAEAYLHNTVDKVWGSVSELGHCKFDDKVALRLAATHVIRQAKEVTDITYDLCSTDSIFKGQDIQKRFQDMHVISQHLQARPEIYSLVGKHYLGLDADSHLIS